jgi:parvulin-like peptidyl-prolyl isomerase
MPHVTKKNKERKETTKPRAKSANPERRKKILTYAVASVVIAAAITLVGVAYYQMYVAPFQRVVITIENNTPIRMRYFLQWARVTEKSGLATLQDITNDTVLKAAESKYGISVSDEDISEALKKQATGSANTTISDFEFNEWYRQLLDVKRVSNSFYRDTIAVNLREALFQKYVNNTIPADLDHAHVYAIFSNTYDEALKVKERLDAGEDFGKVAKEVSIDPNSAENGGELAWIPKGVYLYNMDPFSLEIGKVSEVLAIVDSSAASASATGGQTPTPAAYYVMTVTEIESRPVLAEFLPEIQNTTYQKWLSDETKTHSVKWNYDSEIDSWVNWQLAKSNPPTITPAASGG